MKKNVNNTKQKLFEMMHKVSGMPLNENYTEKQKDFYRELDKEAPTPQDKKNFFLDSEDNRYSVPTSGNEFHNDAKIYFDSLPHNELFDLVSRLNLVSEELFNMLTEEEKKKIIYNEDVVHPQVIINNLKNVEDVKDYIKYVAHQFPNFNISNTFRNIPEKYRMMYIYEVMQLSKNKSIDYHELIPLFFVLEEKNQNTLLRLLDDTKLPYYVAKAKKGQEADDRIYNLKVKRKKNGIKGLPKVEYGAGTYAFYDKDTDTYYNHSAEELKNPNDWDKERKDRANFFDYGDWGNDDPYED